MGKINNFLVGLILFSLSAGLLIPMEALAQIKPIDECRLRHDIDFVHDDCDEDEIVEEDDPAEWAVCCIVDAIFTIADWIFYILIAFVGVMVSIGGFNIVTAGGDPGKVTTGRNYITYAMLGLLVAILSKAIPALTRALIG